MLALRRVVLKNRGVSGTPFGSHFRSFSEKADPTAKVGEEEEKVRVST
jgi:hypothetical protein